MNFDYNALLEPLRLGFNYAETTNEYPEELREVLDSCQFQGSFCCSHTHERYTDPGLSIKTLGIIGLPLSIREAKAIVAECRQATLNQNDNTLVDESVQNIWELNAHEFSCFNPLWPAYLDQLIHQSMWDLGLSFPDSARASPDKLLLFGEGALLKPRFDNEVVPGMFGTLVICLPSAHTGGSMRLVHGNQERTIETATHSLFSMTSLAWYSDVQHELTPVTSGYRLALTYNLIQSSAHSKPSAAALDTDQAQLGNLLQAWNDRCPEIELFVYPLEDNYTKSLSLGALKGRDAATCRFLEKFCSRSGAYWFLADMTMEEREEDPVSFTLKSSVVSSGESIEIGVESVQENEIIVDLISSHKSADSESGDRYMPEVLRYHYTVAIMIRKDRLIRQIAQSKDQSAQSLSVFFELISSDTWCSANTRFTAMDTILQKCLSAVIPNQRTKGYSHVSAYMPTVEMSCTGYIKLFEKAASFCHNHGLSHLVSHYLRVAIETKGWEASKNLTALIANQMAWEATDGRDHMWSSWLSTPPQTVMTYRLLADRMAAFDALQLALPLASIPSFQEWKNEQLDSLLKSVNTYTIEDVEALMKLIPTLPPAKYFDTYDQASLLHFLYHLGVKATSDADQIIIPTYQKLIPVFTPISRPSIQDFAQPKQISTLAFELIETVNQCMRLGLEAEAQNLLSAALPELPPATSTVWSSWRHLFPSLTALTVVLERYNNTVLNEKGSSFITQIIKSSAEYLARSRPQTPRDWSQPYAYKSCGCSPCAFAQNFVVDPARPTAHFQYAQQIRRHIEGNFVNHGDFTFETKKQGGTHTLVQWKNEEAEMCGQLAAMDTVFVSGLIGGDVFQISGLMRVPVPGGAAQGPAATDTERSAAFNEADAKYIAAWRGVTAECNTASSGDRDEEKGGCN
ncbi:hypothetical protein GQ44DRAFT_722171 [Phaeosphaeriaceae sp. PMI808]|nr:hypothetical protein GQ44DRAFT_722171 [Phaeosphaeriaceae sp. PMI808]